MQGNEPKHHRTRIEKLEKRVDRLELKVDRPPPEDVRAWVETYYEGKPHCAEVNDVSLNYVHLLCSGKRPASDKIIKKMIEDGFYGPEMMV